MPANEQTWRDQKLMHAIFAASGVAMLLTTIWMLAADHRREWKQYQRAARDVKVFSTDARLQQEQSQKHAEKTAELTGDLEAQRRAVPSRPLVVQFIKAASDKQEVDDDHPVSEAYKQLSEASDDDAKTKMRSRLLAAMQKEIRAARFVEDDFVSKRKAANADFDVARSQFESAVEHDRPQATLTERQMRVDEVSKDVAALTKEVQVAKARRLELEGILAEITAKEVAAQKKLEDHGAEVRRLTSARSEREISWAESILEWPILDAFNSPTKPQQIWLPKLTINNNFRDVARFDRCNTCHMGIDETQPGSAVDPAYPLETRPDAPLQLATPDNAPKPAKDASIDQQLDDVYGLGFARHGLLSDDNVTVSVVRAEGRAAKAGLRVGDIVEKIGPDKIVERDVAISKLLQTPRWGTPIAVSVRRGLPNPFATHPRLDLFVGSLSPHKMGDIGCTICHEGQGSATQFKWASHTPNSTLQAGEWKLKHGWFNNHHWIFPMMPERFTESMCLKCHHEVAELEPSERFPDPPAPKLMEGYDLIRTQGCFGCHEINGFDGPTKRIGPDLRAEPNYSAAAQALLAKGVLTSAEVPLARTLVNQPENDAARRQLYVSLSNPKAVAKTDPLFAARALDATARLTKLLEDVESPGKLRKVGPSLRHVASKVDFDFLYYWIRNPQDFRPTSKMPRFFGLHKHLESGKSGLEHAQKFEPIEIRAISKYLLAKSEKFEPAVQSEKVTEKPSAERGKTLFRNRGCLACHQHSDFPDGKMTQGPDLSNLGAKFARPENPAGPDWLYSWLKNPSAYHPRTLMPNLRLDPVAVPTADGMPPKAGQEKFSDPAADLTEYLLSQTDRKPHDVPNAEDLSQDERTALADLAREHLSASFSLRTADKYLKEGIPESRRADVKGDELELLAPAGVTPDQMVERQLQYVGRRSITKYGCAGCHDIPGMEDVKPIGTGLADWSRKGADKLAFEQIAAYLTRGPGAHDTHGAHDPHGGGHAAPPVKHDPDEEYFLEALLGHERTGFLWQKLREPRSYDFKKTENKRYNERLRMPQFNLTDAQRESIMTFVLGLVAEPPAPQYVYKPSPRRAAVIAGQKVLDKFNCAGCHALTLDRWKLAFEPNTFPEPTETPDFDYLLPKYTPAEVAVSLKKNLAGKYEATIIGSPLIDNVTLGPTQFDEAGDPIDPDAEEKVAPASTQVVLWDNVLLQGRAYRPNAQPIVPHSAIVRQYPQVGGYLPRLVIADVVRDAKKINPNLQANNVWAWLPPPLVGEGRKVQPDWLHDFLLDPHTIRPAVIMQMPKFNMSSAEASVLVDYFAAVDGAEYPYEFDPRTTSEHLAAAERRRPHRLDDALKIVTNGSYCVQCHLAGDYVPPKADSDKGPQLADVYRRLRSEYMQRWISDPARILPYTTMQKNFVVTEEKAQELYKGKSVEQVQALVDLLANFDRYAKSEFSIKDKVTPATESTDTKTDAAGR